MRLIPSEIPWRLFCFPILRWVVGHRDWITGEVLRSLKDAGVEKSTLVIWVAVRSLSARPRRLLPLFVMPSERVLPSGQRADHLGAAERRLCRSLRRALGGAGYPGLVLRLPVGLRPDADGRAAAALHDQVPRAGNRPDLQVFH